MPDRNLQKYSLNLFYELHGLGPLVCFDSEQLKCESVGHFVGFLGRGISPSQSLLTAEDNTTQK